MATNPPVMGISLGTTNSCVGVWRNGHVTIITNDRGKKTTPSCVAFTYLQRLIGEAANEQTHSDPKNTVFHAKRLIGKRFSDESVQLNMKQWPFEVIGFHDDKPRIVVKYRGEEKQIAAEEISAMVLIKLREMAEAYIKCTVKDAVITVPACFNSTQRQATKDAATIAGLNVLRIINEPTAVAIAYGNQKKPIGEKNIVIFNLGGGTCEVSVVNFQGGKFQVKASAGYTDLGGADFDKNMVIYFVEEIKRVRNKDISKDPMALGRLLKACEKAKKILSSRDYANIDISVNLVDGYFEYYSRISRQEFEEINMALFYKCMKVLENCVSDSGLTIHKVVLVGGSMKIPKVKKLLKDFFGEERLYYDMDKKEAAAFGATAQAPFSANNCMSGMLSSDVTPLPLYYENSVRGMEILFKKNTTLPANSVKSINSEIQGSGVFYRLYQRGTKILISNERIETTTYEFLGKFELSHLTNVLIEIDTSGILKISDEKITDGKKEKAIPKLSNHEIANMIKEAHKYRDDDKKVKAKIALENYCYKMSEIASNWKIMRSSLLKVFGKGIVLDAVKRAIQWSESNPLAEAQEYEKKTKKLQTICKRYGCY